MMNEMRNNANSVTTVKKNSQTVVKNAKRPVAKQKNLHAVRAPQVISIKKKDKAPFPWSVVACAVIMTALFLFMMMNYAEVDKYRGEIAGLNSQITKLEKEQADLKVTLSNKYDLTDIERYASENLGMTKNVPESNVHIITTEQQDKTEMHKYDDGEEGGFGFLLTGLGEVIRDFMGD